MNTVILIEKLNEIEQALGKEEPNAIRRMLIEAQDCALKIQRASVEQMRRDSRLTARAV